MTEAPGVDSATPVPFLVPPAGRPRAASASAILHVRQRLNTRRTQHALDRIAGRVPFPKRVLDVLGSSFLLVLLSPLLIAVSACIKLTDGGPILFWQKR